MTYDVSGNGKTVLKANYGTYWWNPGADFVFNISPNASCVVAALSLDRSQQRQSLAAGRRRRADRRARRRRPPNRSIRTSKNSYTKEFATFLERELMPNFGVRAGYVWRGQRNQYGRYNINRPYSAFTVPVSVRDPGPDGTRRQRRRWRADCGVRSAGGISARCRSSIGSSTSTTATRTITPSRSPAPSA